METSDEDRDAYIESLLDALEKSKTVRLHLEDIISSLHANLEKERVDRENVEAELVRLQEHTLCMREAQQDEIEELEETYKSNTNAVQRVIELENELNEMKIKYKHLSDITKEKAMQRDNVEFVNKQKISKLENENKKLDSMVKELESKETQINYQSNLIRDLLQQQNDNNKTIEALQDKITKLKKNLRSSMHFNGSNNIDLDTTKILISNDSLARGDSRRNCQMTYRVSSSEYSSKISSNSEYDDSFAMKVPRHFISKLWKNFINVCKDNYMFLNSEISSLYTNREYCMISLDGSNNFLGTQLPNAYKEPILCCSQSSPGIFRLNSDYSLTFASTNSPYVGYKLRTDQYFLNAILSKNTTTEPIIFQVVEKGLCILKVRFRNLYLGLINDPFSHSSNILGLTSRYNYTPVNSNYSYSSKTQDSNYNPEPTQNSPERMCSSTSASDNSVITPYKSNEAFTDENLKMGFVPNGRAAKFRLVTLEDYLNIQARKEAQHMMDVRRSNQFEVENDKHDSSDWVIVPEITAFTLARSLV